MKAIKKMSWLERICWSPVPIGFIAVATWGTIEVLANASGSGGILGVAVVAVFVGPLFGYGGAMVGFFASIGLRHLLWCLGYGEGV